MPNINIDDAYILNETGAQVDKVTGLFTKDEDTTSGEKAFAQLNIGASGGGGGSGENLLDNPFFTVNQRSFSSGNAQNQITVDRWLTSGVTTVTVNDNGIIVTTTGNGQGEHQHVSKARMVAGEEYTFSMLTQAGELFSAVITAPSSGYVSGRMHSSEDTMDIRYYITNDANYWDCWFYRQVAGELPMRACKIEKGSVSTLANDPLPEYGMELLKCQYYAAPLEYTTYSNPFTGLAASTTEFFVEAYLPRSMREISNPTISVTGTAYAIRNGSTGAITAWEAGAIKGNHIRLKGTTTNLTANTQVPVYTAGSTLKIFVSADL